jgi:hypothetical protein
MELFNEPIIQKKTLGDVIKNDNVMTNTTMVGGTFNGGKITIGSGNNIFTANKDGIFLGSSSFDTAPFSVNMLGDVIANSIIITGGSLDGTSTIGGRLCSTVAEAIDANGHFIDDRFDTDSKTILSDFTFGTSGALQIGTYSDGVSGDIRISPNGILGRNKDGDTTFSINGTTGEATFGGTLVAASGTFGTVTAGILSGVEISGSTITGGTIQTSSTGQRVEIASSNNTITFYNSSGSRVAQLGGGDYIGTALRVGLDSDTTTGVFVTSSQESDIGFQYASSGNYTSVGTNIQLTGATNTGIGVNINHEGSGGESIYIDTSNGAKGVAISNTGSGESLKILSWAGQSINIYHRATNYNAIELTATSQYDALLINSNLGNGKSAIHTNTYTGSCAFFESIAADPAVTITHSANTGNPALTINKTGIGSGIYIDKNSYGSTINIDMDDSTNNDSVGIEIDVYNGVYPTRALAFNFYGNLRAYASSLGSLSGVIRVKHGGSIGYIPIYSSYS